jgi:glycosyltransferase involved in cell wall biosynthesis
MNVKGIHAVSAEDRRPPGAAGCEGTNTALDVPPRDAGATRAEPTTGSASVAGLTPTTDHPSQATTARTEREHMADPRVSVVIPTYNEARGLAALLRRIPEDVHEVIVVDGYSIDDTVEVARAARTDVRVVLQSRFGKGNALLCGLAAATGDVVVMLDADGSVDPRDIPRFVTALVRGADFVRGNATAGDEAFRSTRPATGHWLDRLACVLFGVAWSDLHYGCSALWREQLDLLGLPDCSNDTTDPLWGDGVEIEPIISMRAMRAGMTITEVPSRLSAQDRSAMPSMIWRDQVRTAGAVCIERLRPIPRPRHSAAS